MDLLSAAQKASARAALNNVFDTWKRPFTFWVEAQTANISTDPNWSRFGQHDQNVFEPAVTPQSYTISGVIRYGNDQAYKFIAPYEGSPNQLKLFQSQGDLKIKVDASGYALMKDFKRVTVDGFTFTMDSTPRPHGIIGPPDRFTFQLKKID